MKKYFDILGLIEGASKEEIREAYERISKELDPAENDNQEFFIEEYNLVQEAYEALTGDDPTKPKEIESNSSMAPDIFKDSDSLVIIIKKYKSSDDDKKLEIIKSLETHKKGNEIYQQALAIIYKNESKNEIIKDSGNDVLSDKEKAGSDKNPVQKSKLKSKKILIGALFFVVLFVGSTYIYFLKKVDDFKSEIPSLIEQSKNFQNSSREFWESKFLENHPEIVNKHLTDGTNKGFLFEESDRTKTIDSVIQFLMYSKTLNFQVFKPDFFECVYYNAVNSDNYWNHYVVGFEKNSQTKKSLPPYIEMLKRTKEKHNVSEKEFEDLIKMVGGLSVFHQAKATDIDVRCKGCLENYQVTYETNFSAITDFYDFTDVYFTQKNENNRLNKLFLDKYNSTYMKLTRGMTQSLKDKLRTKLEDASFPRMNKDPKSFFGSNAGLKHVAYSFDKYDEDLTLLNTYADEIFNDFYLTNSLTTGSTPYRYCYGRNPYCSPPYGYAECSFIDINAPSRTDVIVVIKKNNRVYSHAYIKAGGYYKFKLGNGNFQTFFYYGNGWNPNKFIKNADCGDILGGFVKNESLDKSDVIRLYNSSMTYTLYSVEGGNFSPKTSNKNEAF